MNVVNALSVAEAEEVGMLEVSTHDVLLALDRPLRVADVLRIDRHLLGERLTRMYLDGQVEVRDEIIHEEDQQLARSLPPSQGHLRGEIDERVYHEAEAEVDPGLDLLLASSDERALRRVMARWARLEVVEDEMIGNEELEVHPPLASHAHHLPDATVDTAVATPPVGVPLLDQIENRVTDARAQHQVMIQETGVEIGDMGGDLGDHLLLHPMSTEVADVLTLSEPDQDEMTRD